MTCPTETELLATAETGGAPHCDDCAATVTELRSTIAILRRAAAVTPTQPARPSRWIALAAAVAVVSATSLALLRTPPGPPGESVSTPARQDDEKIRALVRQLGDDSMELRDAAEAELSRLGPKAVPFLEEGLKHEDAEVRSRCADILRRTRRAEALAKFVRADARAARRKALGAETDERVRTALAWLTKSQHADGSWGSTGTTALALLAYLAAAEGESSREHGKAVAKAVAWLLGVQDAQGCIGPRDERYVYGHAIATWALAEAVAGGYTAGDPKAAAQRAVDFLVHAQNPGKGWRYSLRCGDSDTSVTFWCASALAVARHGGFDVPDAAFAGARAWLDEATDADGRVGYTRAGTTKVFVPGVNESFRHHETMTAAALAVERLTGLASDLTPPQAALLTADPPSAAAGDVDYYYWHIASFALFHHDEAAWKAWSAKLVPALERTQQRDGAWDPNDRWTTDAAAGPAFATAINALTLTTPYRYPRLGR